MKKSFALELELEDNEIRYLKQSTWSGSAVRIDPFFNKDIQQLEQKGILNFVKNNYSVHLTEQGKKILTYLKFIR